MDLNSLMNYATSLALLYGWTLFAAVMFALGERCWSSVFARQPAPGGDNKDAAQG